MRLTHRVTLVLIGSAVAAAGCLGHANAASASDNIHRYSKNARYWRNLIGGSAAVALTVVAPTATAARESLTVSAASFR